MIGKKFIKKKLIKLLKKSGKQFYDEEGEPCSVEEYVEILLKQDMKTIQEWQRRLKEGK